MNTAASTSGLDDSKLVACHYGYIIIIPIKLNKLKTYQIRFAKDQEYAVD